MRKYIVVIHTLNKDRYRLFWICSRMTTFVCAFKNCFKSLFQDFIVLCLRFNHKNDLVKFTETLQFRFQCLISKGQLVLKTSLKSWNDHGHASTKKILLTVSQNGRHCFVDPSIHPGLLPLWMLYINITHHNSSIHHSALSLPEVLGLLLK